MKERDVDRLLRLGANGDDDAPSPADDELLQKYRAGRLSPEGEAEVDELLARHPATRRRLVELARAEAPPGSGTPPAASSRGPKLERRAVAATAGVLAVAAAALVMVSSPPEMRSLPAFTVEGPSGFVQTTRGEEAPGDERRLDRTARFRVLLRPEFALEHPLAVAVYVSGPEQMQQRVSGDFARQARGIIEIEASGGQLFGDAGGPKTILVVVAQTTSALDGFGPAARDDSNPAVRSWSFDVLYSPEAGVDAGR